jgi:hypothetical protein
MRLPPQQTSHHGTIDYSAITPLMEEAFHLAYPYPSECANQYWNGDMFRLLSQLSAQVTVDISKFPLPEILQLRTH